MGDRELILNFVQGSPEHMAWRTQGIGGSDLGAILGMDMYRTANDVYMGKTGQAAEFEGNRATEHGQKYEPRARALYSKLVGEPMEAACVQHETYPMCRASLDCLSESGHRGGEIKCPFRGTATMRGAVTGRVVDHYGPQCSYNRALSGAQLFDFFVFQDGHHRLVPVEAHQALEEKLIQFAVEFWNNHVLRRIPPPLESRDILLVTDRLITDICQSIAHEHKKLPAHHMNFLKERVVRLAGHPRVRCGNVLITTVNPKGSQPYHKLTINQSKKLNEAV